MASLVGRSAATRSVERKSASRSDYMNGLFSEGDREDGQEKCAFNPRRDRSFYQKPHAIVHERTAVEICRNKYDERAAPIHLHANDHYPGYDTARLEVFSTDKVMSAEQQEPR